MAWPDDDLRDARSSTAVAVVVLDPERLLTTGVLDDIGDVRLVQSSWDLWQVFERDVRERSTVRERIVLHVVASNLRTASDLPIAIAQAAHVGTIRWPFAPTWLEVWRALGDEQAARLVAWLLESQRGGASDVISYLFGVLLPQPDVGAEFEAVVRLRTAHSLPEPLWQEVRPLLHGHLAQAVAKEPPDAGTLQAEWSGWMENGANSSAAAVFGSAPGAVLALLNRGLLQPARRSARDVPDWTAPGAIDTPAEEAIETQLAQRPNALPATLEAWVKIAEWWGEVRATMASSAPLPPELVERCWTEWSAIDRKFVPWIQANHGDLMARSQSRPATVDKIAPFLARRMRAGIKRVLLVVMDGMAFAQWSIVRHACRLSVLDGGGTVAMLPTLTSFSRQAIFAGTAPIGFADTVMTTSHERDRWRAFWTGEGLAPHEVRYENIAGAIASQVPSFGRERAFGLAVLAIDAMMHGAELLGDAQLAASIHAWSVHGFMRTLVQEATSAGFEVWVTADHGNLESIPAGKVSEGLLVEHAGRRARSYSSPSARDAARAEGIAWDPPGLPENAPSFLFASGRRGWISRSAQVIHGSLSIDEVIVPFVRVGP